jgi:hypothetical protein
VLPPLLLLLPPWPGDRLVHPFEDQAQECEQSFPAQALTPLADPFVETKAWLSSCGQELGGDKRWDGPSGGRVRSLTTNFCGDALIVRLN